MEGSKFFELASSECRALEAREKVLGIEHPSTLTSVSNLALVLQYQGKYEATDRSVASFHVTCRTEVFFRGQTHRHFFSSGFSIQRMPKAHLGKGAEGQNASGRFATRTIRSCGQVAPRRPTPGYTLYVYFSFSMSLRSRLHCRIVGFTTLGKRRTSRGWRDSKTGNHPASSRNNSGPQGIYIP